MGVRSSGLFCLSIIHSPVEDRGYGKLVTPAIVCFPDYVSDKLSESKSDSLYFYQSNQPDLGLAFVVGMCMAIIPPRMSIM